MDLLFTTVEMEELFFSLPLSLMNHFSVTLRVLWNYFFVVFVETLIIVSRATAVAPSRANMWPPVMASPRLYAYHNSRVTISQTPVGRVAMLFQTDSHYYYN